MGDIFDSLLTGGVGAALVVLFGNIILWYLGNKKTEVLELTSNDFEGISDFQATIDRVLTDTGVQRVLMMKTENGGGKPRLGTHLYASVLYEGYKHPLNSVKDDYQRILVDDIYVKMLSDIGPSTSNKLIVSRMKDGILKKIYQRETIIYSEVHYIGETDDAFFYISFSTTNNDDKFDEPNNRVEIEIAVSKIRRVFEEIKK
jgi:hypothetical protein